MFIQTEETPNPTTLKFLPGREILPPGKQAEFISVEDAARAPLARALFAVPGVRRVYLDHHFLAVSLDEGRSWDDRRTSVLSVIMTHFTTGLPAVDPGWFEEDGAHESEEAAALRSEIENQIVEILETRVRPAVAQDGGDISFERFEKGIVYVRMRGACAGCPSATATLKSGIENLLCHFIPEVIEVRAVQD